METLTDLSPPGLLVRIGEGVRRRRLLEVEELALALAWADVHSGEATDLVALGGDGTPLVRDACLGEFALARSTGAMAAISAIADALDLRHRLPKVWEAAQAGEVDMWVPRRVAKLSRHLPAGVVWVVDAAVAPLLGHEGAGRILEVAEAKVIEADPALHQQRTDEARRGRCVTTSRSNEHGLRTVIARIDAGDAVWVEATVARVAAILAPNHQGLSVDELRALAFGHLARPAELLALLLEHLDPEDDFFTDLGIAPPPPPDPAAEAPRLNRALAFPADLLDALRSVDWRRLAPKAVVYVHLHESALHGARSVARVEGLGPHGVRQLQSLLGGMQVHVKPVIDLNDRVRTTAYEHPTSLRERVHLITGGDYWPWATSTSRNVDLDHVTPYQPPAPPRAGTGQTGTHNSGPLGRRHHRWKTHAGYRARQAGTGRYVWKTPHGLAFAVDHAGTRSIPAEDAEAIINAPPDVDLYMAPTASIDLAAWSACRV